MKTVILGLTLLAAPVVPAFAANADAPNTNVDKSNDAGGSTGNAQTDRLNSGQLDQNQRPSGSAAPPK